MFSSCQASIGSSPSSLQIILTSASQGCSPCCPPCTGAQWAGGASVTSAGCCLYGELPLAGSWRPTPPAVPAPPRLPCRCWYVGGALGHTRPLRAPPAVTAVGHAATAPPSPARRSASRMQKEVTARFTLWSYPGKCVRGTALRGEPGHKASRTELLTVERGCGSSPSLPRWHHGGMVDGLFSERADTLYSE